MSEKRIKEEGLKLFALNDYSSTSMAMIAQAVGLKKASLYSHFTSKEALFMAIAEDVLTANKIALTETVETLEDKSIEAKLHELFKHLSFYPFELGKNWEFTFFSRVSLFPPNELKELLGSKMADYEQQLNDQLEQIFIAGIKDKVVKEADLATLIYAFYCLADGVRYQVNFYEDDKFFDMAQAAWQVYWLGIRL